jgi:hypothetical protein
MAKKGRKAKDLDPKAKGKSVRGGMNIWQDNKDKLPLGTGKVVDDVVVKPIQRMGKNPS